MIQDAHALYATHDGIATLTLNRPEARNAWSQEMIDGTHAALDAAARDPEVKVLIVTGAGKAFCAGGDLRAMRDREGMFAGDTVELRGRYADGLQNITRHFERFDKPTIAAVNGAAIGAGLDLALMCDLRVASSRAKFGSTFAAVGLIPGDGGAYLLTRVVGFPRAVELILTARVIDAARAEAIDLVHEVVPPEEVTSRANEIASEIARLPAPAVRMAKVALRKTYNRDMEVALELTAALQGLVQHTEAHEQAVLGMLAKIGKG